MKMGGGRFSQDLYDQAPKGRAAYKDSDAVLRKPRNEQKADEQLNPYGLYIRESRDSEEHPNSNAIGVGLDITGTMAAVVVEIRDGLGGLMGMLLDYKIIDDPQVLFYAVGDHTMRDAIPVQISQFESDIRINDQLSKVVLVGGGGGNGRESYQLGYYAMAKHTAMDCLEKRQKKGYLVDIGDEMAYDEISAREVKEIFGAKIGKDIPTKQIVKELKEKFNMLHVIPKGSACFNDPAIRAYWEKLLGKERVVYPSAKAVCPTIAVFIGLSEGKFDLEGGCKMVEKALDKNVAKEVGQVLKEFADSLGEIEIKKDESGSGTKNKDSIDPDTGKKKPDWLL